MVLTRSFKDHVKAKIESDPEFRQALFQEAVQTLISGDVDTARAVLRDFINATIGFAALAKATANTAEEPDADVRAERQSDRGQSFRASSGSAEKDRRASRSPRGRFGGLKVSRSRVSICSI